MGYQDFLKARDRLRLLIAEWEMMGHWDEFDLDDWMARFEAAAAWYCHLCKEVFESQPIPLVVFHPAFGEPKEYRVFQDRRKYGLERIEKKQTV
jgi:hypothetical protein